MEVYGCQMNVHDAEIIAGIMEGCGYTRTPDAASAEVVLVVTCAVREHAERRTLGRISQLAGARRGMRGRLVVCGCVAQEHGAALLDDLPGVDLVVGPDRYRSLPDLLGNGLPGRCCTTFDPGETYEGVDPVRGGFPRSFVTVMRGCDNRCSYCIVPDVRGCEKSRAFPSIVDEVSGLRDAGYGEITLLGQNVNSYRWRGKGFADLLRAAADAARPSWVRFVTSHPRDFGPDIVEVMAEYGNVCSQLHLPFQSGDDTVLRRMRRGYTRAEYLERIAATRKAIPDVVLSTDVLVGFPGESEDAFERSVSLLEEVQFDYAFLFRYSPRRGTPAAAMSDQVPETERMRRLNRIQEVQRGITVRRSRQTIGREVTLLVTGPSPRGGAQQAGRTQGNRLVVLEGTAFPPGSFIEARITDADGWTHFAVPVDGTR